MRLKTHRLAKGLTQEELAERSGIARLTVLKLERDGRASLDSFLRIIGTLGLQGELENLFELKTTSIAELERLDRLPQRAPRRKG